MAVYVFVCVYICVCVVWWWGSALSLSLWIVAGMVVVGPDSRAGGEGLWPDSNCGDAEELERAITGRPTATSSHTLTYPAAFNYHAS
jgi:hypothetical protein